MTLTNALVPLDLSLEKLDEIEAPLSDTEWGVIAGAAFGFAMWGAYAIAVT